MDIRFTDDDHPDQPTALSGMGYIGPAPDPADVPTVGLSTGLLCGGSPARGGATLTPYYCPVCRGGREDSGCLYCERTGLVDGERIKGWPPAEVIQVPRPPGVRRAPCGDCAFLPGSPELDADPDRTLFKPDAPFFCHQGMAEVAGQYQPAAWWAGLPLGYLLCAGWWDLFTRDKIHSRRYIELEEVRQRVAIEREDRGLPPLGALEMEALEVEAQAQQGVAEFEELADILARAVLKACTPPLWAQAMAVQERDAVLEGIRTALRMNAVNIRLEAEPVVFDKRPERYVLTLSWALRPDRP
jgi:hypothetical protein